MIGLTGSAFRTPRRISQLAKALFHTNRKRLPETFRIVRRISHCLYSRGYNWDISFQKSKIIASAALTTRRCGTPREGYRRFVEHEKCASHAHCALPLSDVRRRIVLVKALLTNNLERIPIPAWGAPHGGFHVSPHGRHLHIHAFVEVQGRHRSQPRYRPQMQ
jgi:hypothetical protein